MSLKSRIDRDRSRVFLQMNHFADAHTWNGVAFTCVTDEETALKRKNNNVNDLSWDNNTRETLVYVRKEDWPGHTPVPYELGYFDRMSMRILQVNEDMGMYSILLTTPEPRTMQE